MDSDSAHPDDMACIWIPSYTHNDSAPTMDSDTAQLDDIGVNTDSDFLKHNNPGPNVDTGDVFFDDTGCILNTDTTVSRHCANCGSDVTGRKSHALTLEDVRLIIQQWIAPQVIMADTVICHSCWTLALNSNDQVNVHASTSGGHRRRQLCVNCGRSLLNSRAHSLRVDSERETQIRQLIMTRINPRELQETDQICHPCWQRYNRQVTRKPRPVTEHTITLPHLKRASDTQGHCFFPQCNAPERLVVPKWLRVMLFTEYEYYVPSNCRICTFHLQNDHWQMIRNIEEPIHNFTAQHIEDFASFVKERK